MKLFSALCLLVFMLTAAVRGGEDPVYRIRMCWLPQAQFAGFYVAEHDGLFTRAGVKVIIEHSRVDDNLFQLLTDNKIDFCVTWLTMALQERLAGRDIVNVLQLNQRSPELLVAKKSSGIRTPADLVGRRVGIWPQEDFRFSFMKFLEQQQPRGVRVLPVLTNVDMLLYDGVDLISAMSFNEYQQIIFAGYNPDELTVFRMRDYFPDLATDGLYCRGDTWRRFPNDVRKIRAAVLEGWRRAAADSERVLWMISEYCRNHNSTLGRINVEFNPALQRRMLLDIIPLMSLSSETEAGRLRPATFAQGLKILGKDENALTFADFVTEAGK